MIEDFFRSCILQAGWGYDETGVAKVASGSIFLKMAIFPHRKNTIDWKIWETDLLSRLKPGESPLHPLVVQEFMMDETARDIDARVTMSLPGDSAKFHFVVEAKSRSTPLTIRTAVAQVRAAANKAENPMIIVPYLSEERLRELERDEISGIDLCGNGVIVIPRRLYLFRTGEPNRYPDSRPLSNPYSGRSAMVARILFSRRTWYSLNEIAMAIQKSGEQLSLAQISKALKAMEQDTLVMRSGVKISIADKSLLLDKLALGWKPPYFRNQQAFRLETEYDWARNLSRVSGLRWAVIGESSIKRYSAFSEQGPLKIAVSDFRKAMNQVEGKPERVPNFAHIELLETDQSGFYFQNEIDDSGIRWASRLQTYLELQAGDARQRDVSRELREQISKYEVP